MTSTVLPSSAQTDDADLTSLGYEPSLHRKLGRYASFAAGFSFVSILTTIFQLFAFGYSFAGPAFFWTWPVVLLGQLLVALNFAELAARYPLSGAVYQWARRVGGETVGWFAGWFMALAQVVTAAAAAIAARGRTRRRHDASPAHALLLRRARVLGVTAVDTATAFAEAGAQRTLPAPPLEAPFDERTLADGCEQRGAAEVPPQLRQQGQQREVRDQALLAHQRTPHRRDLRLHRDPETTVVCGR